MQELSSHSRDIVEAGVAAGLYATPVPLQIFAYRSAQLAQVDMARTHLGADTLLGGRVLELLRIRSAQLGECEPCSQSRKHDSITDEDVVCLLAPEHASLTPQEQIAVEFLDRLSGDHRSIDDDFYRRLGEHFTAAQIIELGFTCHRDGERAQRVENPDGLSVEGQDVGGCHGIAGHGRRVARGPTIDP